MSIKKKLKSQSGASIMFALLLFLVCAVLGSVVLVAGTAAAGRVSRMAETDQRYYCVTSAAELLAKEICSQEVTIVRTKTVETTTVKEYSVSGTHSTLTGTTTNNHPTFKTVITSGTFSSAIETDGSVNPEGSAIDTSGMSYLTARAVNCLFGGNNCNKDAAMGYSFSAGGFEEAETEFKLTHDSSDVDASKLTIKGTSRTGSDGTIYLTVSDGAASDNYTLIITLHPAFTETKNSVSSDSAPATVTSTAGGFREESTAVSTATVTSKISWSIDSIRKEVQ